MSALLKLSLLLTLFMVIGVIGLPYLLAPTNTFTLTGPDVNMAARIPQPKITFTK